MTECFADFVESFMLWVFFRFVSHVKQMTQHSSSICPDSTLGTCINSTFQFAFCRNQYRRKVWAADFFESLFHILIMRTIAAKRRCLLCLQPPRKKGLVIALEPVLTTLKSDLDKRVKLFTSFVIVGVNAVARLQRHC